MKVRDLLAQLNNLPLSHLDLEVYIDVEGDEYRELEIVPIVSADDETIPMGYVICEDKEEDGGPVQLELPFDPPLKRAVH